MRHELAILFLWLIAIVTVIVAGPQARVLPVFAFCMIGSILIVRAARRAP